MRAAMPGCRQCGARLPRRSYTYCSNACQQEYRRVQMVAEWLASGECVPGTHARHYVRSYLLADQGGTCAICEQGTSWNGRLLAFILDHIDGDAQNNCRANLRLVCPNCDSQLETFKSRNRGQGRHARRERYAAGKSY